MKSKFTLLMLVLGCVFGMKAQLIFTENFNSFASVTADGWVKINNSSPAGSTTWFMGNPSTFPAYNGADTSYFAANYNNTSGATGTISTWLISPTVSLSNGGVIRFATRTNTVAPTSTVSPDRLQVYMSVGTSTTIPAGPTSMGTFTTLLTSVNPSLTTNGYPTSWTVYTTTLSGITGTVTGRFGFRYSVPSAGPSGINSSYIGLDNIVYSLPCANPTISISSSTTGICTGNLATLTGSGATTYTWVNTGQTTASVAVSPTANTVYTLTGSSIPNCNSSQTIAITTTLTPMLSVLDVTTCPGTAATLAASGAPSYSWSTGATTSSIVVTPTASTIYSLSGINNGCVDVKLVSVTLGTSLSINPASTQSLICNGSSAVLTASGASTYSFSSGANNTQSATVSPTTTTTYTVNGASGTCFGSATLVVNVNPSPSVTLSGPANGTICPLNSFSITASGASSYSWTGFPTTSSLITTSASLAGTYNYSVVATGTNGCTRPAALTVTVSACTGIETYAGGQQLSVYPNPFGNELKIGGFNGSVEIYNALGQLMLKEAVSNASAVNTSELIKGVYILKAFNEEHKAVGTSKIIKN